MFMPTLRCECAQPASDRLMRKWCISELNRHGIHPDKIYWLIEVELPKITTLYFERILSSK